MKKIILILIVIHSTFYYIYAQEKFKHGNMKIGEDIYGVIFSNEYPSIGISNLSKNLKDIPRPKTNNINGLLPIREEDMYFDVENEKTIVVKVLNDKIDKLKRNKESIRIDYVFYPDGRVMNIEYGLSKQTSITPKDLAKIDENLRNNLKMKFTGDQYKAYPAIYFNKKRIFF